MNKEKLKIVVVGCGRFSQFFVPLFKAHPVVEKVYVCDLKKDREEEFANRFGVDRMESFESALKSKEVNAIAIFTQRFKHGQMVIDALKAGKHVYSAVPCAVSVDEIIEIESPIHVDEIYNRIREVFGIRLIAKNKTKISNALLNCASGSC